jgi:hypothetical protein
MGNRVGLYHVYTMYIHGTSYIPGIYYVYAMDIKIQSLCISGSFNAVNLCHD